jgi:hypothetical protein
MVAKHVHATVVTRLHQYTREASRSETERQRIEDVLKTCLPDRVSTYLFEDGLVRDRPFDLTPLQVQIPTDSERPFRVKANTCSEGS